MANLINGLGGSAGFGEDFLDRNDDSSSGFIDFRSVFESGINLGGVTYNGFYVNNNGNITFASSSGEYIPSTLKSVNYPIIAAFWRDVDTRAGVLTPSAGGTSTGSNLVYWDLDAANNTVTVTWDDVGEYNNGTTPNAFQLRLTDLGGGDALLELRYESIDWGSGAQAGYATGDRFFFSTVPGAGTGAVLNWEAASNVGIPGVFQFTLAFGQLLRGTGRSDTLNGTDRGDRIFGLTGNDILNGGNGNDYLNGGGGNDTLTGGSGKDTLLGGAGTDTLIFSSLSDSLSPNFDSIRGLEIGIDQIDGPTALTADQVAELGSVANLTQAGIQAVLTSAAFSAGGAATFQFRTRTFLALNDAVAGFDQTTDSIIEITSYTGNLTDLAIV